MADAVEVEVTSSAEDVAQGMAEMPENVAAELRLKFFAAAAFFMFCLRLYQSGELTPEVGVWLVISGLWGAFVVGRRYAMRRHQAALRREGEKAMSYRFDGEGVRIQSPLADVSIRYPALHRFVEGPSSLLLYTHANVAQIVPKRAFSAEQLELIRGWLARGVTPRQQPRAWLRPLLVWALLGGTFLLVWAFLV